MIDVLAKVSKNTEIAKNIFKMEFIHNQDIEIKGGQFVQVKLNDKSALLRRPFGVSNFDREKKSIEIIYQVKGKGTLSLSKIKEGEELKVLLPLGNGFTIEENQKKVVLLGGGMGSVVLPSIIATYPDKQFYTYLGFADIQNVILEDIANKSEKYTVCTDNGSYGNKGFVTNILKDDMANIDADIILACGPEPMYRAMQKVFSNPALPIQISLEGRMGCGFGACLVCICKIKTVNGLDYLRVCKDGPVFALQDVVF